MRRSDDNITFEENGARTADFLHELNDPDLVRPRSVPSAVMAQLRREQVAKLEQNITVLRSKQVEFNSKMEEYIDNLRRLIHGLEKTPSEAEDVEKEDFGTYVRCTKCEADRVFEGLHVLFARESSESFSVPTQCYVSYDGRIKKGMFTCRDCGGDSLTIRARNNLNSPLKKSDL